MKNRKWLVVLAAAAVFVPLTVMTQIPKKVSQQPEGPGLSVGRSQAYQEILDRKDYRTFKNSNAPERGIEAPSDAKAAAEAVKTGDK